MPPSIRGKRKETKFQQKERIKEDHMLNGQEGVKASIKPRYIKEVVSAGK